jgi:soluble lytic murein transglycosylase
MTRKVRLKWDATMQDACKASGSQCGIWRKSLFALALVMAALVVPGAQQAGSALPPGDAARSLAPTNHPRVPAALSQLWMAPERGSGGRPAALNDLASAVKMETDADYAKALPLLTQPHVQQGPLADYALYYTGLAEIGLGRPADARLRFAVLQARRPVGYLAEAAALREAECDEALGDQAAALTIYERLAAAKTTTPDDVLMRLGRAAKAVANPVRAAEAFSRVYYEFPFSDLSPQASAELDALPNRQPIAPGNDRYHLEFGRAERLFGAKRYGEARAAFAALRIAASGDDPEIVNLRLAECDYFTKRLRSARDGARPYIGRASRQAEAIFFYAVAIRDLGASDEYVALVRRLVDEFPDQSWAEEALNSLGTYYLVHDDEESADRTLRELSEKFPSGRYAERAAWKIGWRAYETGRFAETARIFEKAAGDFPRSDYRPAWLYWAGRSYEAQNNKPLADARYSLAAIDYLNVYYGRLAVSRLDGWAPERRLVVDVRSGGQGAFGGGEAAPLAPNEPVVRALLGIEAYDQAIDELLYAQKMWGDSSVIQATLAWIYHQQGDLRKGITAMKRAYPQYMAAGGEDLPTELLEVLFPVAYWPLIRKYSTEHGLDPYLVAALIGQESTFQADARSPSNAYGLMQIIPPTGRRYARVLQMKSFSVRMLTTAETNVRMGTTYLADLMKRFGSPHLALAGYNAGEGRVARWLAERPGVDREQFVEDIPFFETQNYVKRILGTAENYRRLYGGELGLAAEKADAAPPRAAARPGAKAATPTKAAGATARKKRVAPPLRKAPPPATKTKAKPSAAVELQYLVTKPKYSPGSFKLPVSVFTR